MQKNCFNTPFVSNSTAPCYNLQNLQRNSQVIEKNCAQEVKSVNPIIYNNQIVYNIHLPYGLNNIMLPSRSTASHDSPENPLNHSLGNKRINVTNRQNNIINF